MPNQQKFDELNIDDSYQFIKFVKVFLHQNFLAYGKILFCAYLTITSCSLHVAICNIVLLVSVINSINFMQRWHWSDRREWRAHTWHLSGGRRLLWSSCNPPIEPCDA